MGARCAACASCPNWVSHSGVTTSPRITSTPCWRTPPAVSSSNAPDPSAARHPQARTQGRPPLGRYCQSASLRRPMQRRRRPRTRRPPGGAARAPGPSGRYPTPLCRNRASGLRKRNTGSGRPTPRSQPRRLNLLTLDVQFPTVKPPFLDPSGSRATSKSIIGIGLSFSNSP
jgi:hypothetical protein